ncbi:conserved hypothetical protein [Xylanimonas cellulosilytica DSM 15894]|uniref:MrfA-like Zn-binding domain-containing protein n=1 Tax=Xylanimonas cellulosilytica (strain DSM 15894 / JCM 12276 / CECT 5975 / KCTC 9989 / LMG 20990 / NBRC 107835 / XIL07) TaxID=446471 RepID=D1BVL9_XYLCX|nr:DUF1998 domain-containing protein [Xylanimonas cellulosilytica]ACZ31338.1 conserved hypothetical protein [Xylanimonas cellulosilytica DSM 15894]
MTDLLDSTPDALDPLGDLDAGTAQKATKNRAKVGSARPSSLLYTYGPGAIMDLPQFTVMPSGLDDWDRVWARRASIPRIHAPRLLDVVRRFLGYQVTELRPFPWAPKTSFASKDGDDLGVPARVFPQWLRCTGCDMLAPLTRFSYVNTNPFRPDQARFEHEKCPGYTGRPSKVPRQAVPARFLLACVDGHLDEFPYDWWVHRGGTCPAGVEFPPLRMSERTVGKGASATVHCGACSQSRPMNEAQGELGKSKLPRCRGRHPHLGVFDPKGCINEAKLMLLGASNLWFPATQSIIVMPDDPKETASSRADDVRAALGDNLTHHADNPVVLRALVRAMVSALAGLTDDEIDSITRDALAPPPSDTERADALEHFDPVELLVPEWQYLQRDPGGARHVDPNSGLALSKRLVADDLISAGVTRVLAVDKLRKVNAVVGFTRIDEMERANDLPARLAPLTRNGRPAWAVAAEDRGEGIYLQLDEHRVAAWEQEVLSSKLWDDHRESHRRNFNARFSQTSSDVDPDTRLKPPRYWLIHTLSHVLIREMAMYSGYSAASLSERIYAWPASDDRPAAAGLLIVTTASDSDGTLGGLVQLSSTASLERVMKRALERAHRCSSDPVCAQRTPKEPEDFLHGAACHTCAMASETSCERANRFLDRRFLVPLPGLEVRAFFG